jgi:AmmeMemoRadiSam system protein A
MTEHALVQLARSTIVTFIRQHKVTATPSETSLEMQQRAGVFVSLHRGGELRGCIGTIEPTQAHVAQEIIANAISAATRDPRFPPVRSDELDDLEISVDVLGAAEPINSIHELDPKRYGVIVESGYRRGLLLPDLEGVDTGKYQVEIALRKAGIRPQETYKLFRFKVLRYH